MPTFISFPLGVTSGAYQNTFDMTLASSWNPHVHHQPWWHAGVGVRRFLAAWLAGQPYLNIHTDFAPGGEIRGQLLQVPEPATLALLGLALAGLGALRRGRAG